MNGAVKPLQLIWYQVSCRDCKIEHGPTPAKEHAQQLHAQHAEHDAEIVKVKLDWHLASCECGWEGNPAAQQRGARSQLRQHDAEAHGDAR